MTTLYLVGCGKAKLDRPAPARELYTGSLFRAARAYVEALVDPWCIVSAEHGLVHPGTLLEPYDASIRDHSPSTRKAWAGLVLSGVYRRLGCEPSFQGHTVVLLMGREYADDIRPHLVHKGAEVLEPLRGMGLGARLAWLKSARVARCNSVSPVELAP